MTKAKHCIRISGCSASNQWPTKRLVTAWCCFSQCLVVTWLLREHEAWDDTLKSGEWKISILARSEHVTWWFLKKSASAGEFWVLVRNLGTYAKSAAGNVMSGKSWNNLVSPVDAPPSCPGTLSEIRVHERHTWIHSKRRGWNEMKWNHVMSCYVTMSCRHGWFLA